MFTLNDVAVAVVVDYLISIHSLIKGRKILSRPLITHTVYVNGITSC